jgi:hypothetical protein
MATIDEKTREALQRLSADTDASDDIAEIEAMNDAEVRAELRAAGIDADGAYARMRRRFAHLFPDRSEAPTLLSQFAEGVALILQESRELLVVTAAGMRQLHNTYAPALLHAQPTSAALADTFWELDQPALLAVNPTGERIKLGLRWPDEPPPYPPAIRGSIGGAAIPTEHLHWETWDPVFGRTHVLSVEGVDWPEVGTASDRPLARYRWNAAENLLDLELLPED